MIDLSSWHVGKEMITISRGARYNLYYFLIIPKVGFGPKVALTQRVFLVAIESFKFLYLLVYYSNYPCPRLGIKQRANMAPIGLSTFSRGKDHINIFEVHRKRIFIVSIEYGVSHTFGIIRVT